MRLFLSGSTGSAYFASYAFGFCFLCISSLRLTLLFLFLFVIFCTYCKKNAISDVPQLFFLNMHIYSAHVTATLYLSTQITPVLFRLRSIQIIPVLFFVVSSISLQYHFVFIDAFKRNCFRARNKSIFLHFFSFFPLFALRETYKIKPASAFGEFLWRENAFSFRFPKWIFPRKMELLCVAVFAPIPSND